MSVINFQRHKDLKIEAAIRADKEIKTVRDNCLNSKEMMDYLDHPDTKKNMTDLFYETLLLEEQKKNEN